MDDQYFDESVQKPSLRFWVGIGVAVVVFGAALWLGYSYLFPGQSISPTLGSLTDIPPQSSAGASSPSPAKTSSEPAAPSSSLVTTKDTISGFQVAHPPQWTVQSQDGFVLLRSDECGSAAAIVYPIQLLGSPPKPIDLLATTAGPLLDQLKDGRQGMNLGSIGADGETGATALLSGLVCGSDVTGTAQLVTTSNRSLLKLAWYPVALQQQLTNTLTAILYSYRTVVATSTLGYQGTVFQLPVPDGSLFEETSASGSVHSGDRLFRLSQVDFSADQPLDGALDTWLTAQKEAGQAPIDSHAESSTEQSGDDAAGHRYNTKTRFLTYQKDGAAYRGVLTAAYTDPLGNHALILWRTAPAKEWSLAEPLLLLTEQGAIYQANPASPALRVPVYATWRDASPLTGTGIRTALNSAANRLWQPLILSPIQLRDAVGNRYLAPLNALNPDTGTYNALKDGKQTTLQPIKPDVAT